MQEVFDGILLSNQSTVCTSNFMRRLDFDQSDHEIQNSDQKSNSLLLKKNIFKKKTNIIKFITPPSCNFSKKSLKLKSFTPIPEKNNQLFELGLNKTRSFSNVIDFEKNDEIIETIDQLEPTHCLSNASPFISINKDKMERLIRQNLSNLLIIDCRYDYEYNGGHIKNAININDPFTLIDLFYNKSGFNKNLFNKLLTKSNLTSFEDTPLKNLSTIFNGIVIKREDDFTSFDDYKNLIIVFHCEFSKNRAPKMYNLMRSIDRELNFNEYPKLYYPQIFVLEDGYSVFSQNYNEMCIGEYRKMRDKRFINDLLESHKKSKTNWEIFNKNKEIILNSLKNT